MAKGFVSLGQSDGNAAVFVVVRTVVTGFFVVVVVVVAAADVVAPVDGRDTLVLFGDEECTDSCRLR